jgi:hypothetical protein
MGMALIQGQPELPKSLQPLQPGGELYEQYKTDAQQALNDANAVRGYAGQMGTTAGQIGAVADPLKATGAKFLTDANAGTIQPGQQYQIDQWVQQQQSALFQQLANQGISDPTRDSRYVSQMANIMQQAEMQKQNIIQQNYTQGGQYSNEAASVLGAEGGMYGNAGTTVGNADTIMQNAYGNVQNALTTVAQAELAQDAQYQSALNSAMQAFGMMNAPGLTKMISGFGT